MVNAFSTTPCESCIPKADIQNLAEKKGIPFKEIDAEHLSAGIGFSAKLNVSTPLPWVVVLKLGDTTAFVGTDGLDLQVVLNQLP